MKKTGAATLIGYYGSNNLGDDIFCHLFSRELRLKGYHELFVPQASANLAKQLGLNGPIKTKEAIDRSDIVVMGGGGQLGLGTIQRFPFKQFYYYWKTAWYCWLKRKPLYLLGVGAGPFSDGLSRQFVKDIVRISKVVAVRESQSKQELVNISKNLDGKIQISSDPAYAMDYDELKRNGPTGTSKMPSPCLGVNLCVNHSFEGGIGPEAVVLELIKTVKHLLSKGTIASVVWFSNLPYGGELKWSCRAYQALPDQSRLVFYDEDPWNCLSQMSLCDAFISMKLHSAVFAAGMGLPILGVGYHPKIIRFYESMNAADFYLPIEKVSKPEEIMKFVLDRLPGKKGLSESHEWQDLRSKAAKLFEIIPPSEIL